MAMTDINNRILAITDEAIGESQKLMSSIDRLRTTAGKLSIFDSGAEVEHALSEASRDMQNAVKILTKSRDEADEIIANHNR